MVIDVGVVKNHIKPKADSTLYNMRKVDLIEYIRTLEHNYNVAVSFNENQARYIESLGFNGVVFCKDCEHSYEGVANLMCGRCGQNKNGIRLGGVSVKEEHFCSYGERREGE